jgi:threonine dehydratase
MTMRAGSRAEPEPGPLSVAAVRSARELLDGVVTVTPTAQAVALSELLGVPVHLKCENLQRTGSFKLRGAYVRLARLSPAERARGVVAASAGNHGQGVALAAQMLGIPATVFMPTNASLPKVVATTGYGAAVELVGESVDDAIAAARSHAESTGAVLVHPFDHPDVVAGQGTIGLEILEQVPQVRTIVVPAGGGGLLAGIALAVSEHRPDVEVVGVQSLAMPSLTTSLAAQRPVDVGVAQTIADGIAVSRPGAVPFEVIQARVPRVVTVSEALLAQGLLHCLERYKVLVEPAGAAGVSALLDAPATFAGPVVVVLSGGNVDPLLLDRILRSGLSSSGRFLELSVWLRDRPGSLAALLGHLAAQQVNIVAVEHHRLDPSLGVDEVEVGLELEMRGPEHCAALVQALLALGYRVATVDLPASNVAQGL